MREVFTNESGEFDEVMRGQVGDFLTRAFRQGPSTLLVEASFRDGRARVVLQADTESEEYLRGLREERERCASDPTTSCGS